MTTALVLVTAVLVAFAIRLFNNSNNAEQVAVFVPADDLTLPGTTDAHYSDTPHDDSHEANVDMPGVIDRHHVDLQHMKPPTESTTEDILNEGHESAAEITTPTSPTTEPTTEVKTTTTRDPNVFKEVDIRYYANSEAGLNLREEPSTKSKIIKKLDYGTPLRVIGLNDEWAKVRLSGLVFGYVSRDFITKYRPVTETSPPTTTTTKTTTTTTKKTTTTTTTTKTLATTTTAKKTTTTASEPVTEETSSTTTATTTRTTVKPPEGGIQFVNPGTGSNSAAHANLSILKKYGLINKEGSSSINRHYETFTDNGDGTITVDGITFTYAQAMPGRRATHYDGVEVCRYQINRSSTGKCRLGHTKPTCHGTASGLLAQRGIVAVGSSDLSIYPRGAVVFVRGYGMAVVGDRSGGCFDLCYDADECKLLTRSNWTNGIYIITPSP